MGKSAIRKNIQCNLGGDLIIYSYTDVEAGADLIVTRYHIIIDEDEP